MNRFIDELGNWNQQIGNAVPPLLVYHIAKHIKDKLLNGPFDAVDDEMKLF